MESTKELEMMKDGARRVEQYLASQGVTLKHSLMLEALSAGFGSRNWRTVQQKLNAPSAPPAPTLEDLEGKRWEVHAIYVDNDQSYCDDYAGETAMEAAITAQVERVMDEEGAEILVVSVIDRFSHRGEDYCGAEPDCRIVENSKAFGELAAAARKLCPVWTKKREKAASEKERMTEAALQVLEDISQGKKSKYFYVPEIDEINRHTRDWCEGFFEGARFQWTVGSKDVDMSGSEAVEAVLDILAARGVEAMPDWLKQRFFQAKALVKYAKHELDYLTGTTDDEDD